MSLTAGDEPGENLTSTGLDAGFDAGFDAGLDEPLLREIWAWVVVDPPRGERLTAIPVGDTMIPMVAGEAASLQRYRREVVEAVRATGLTHRLLVFGRDELPSPFAPSSRLGARTGQLRGGRTCVDEVTPAQVAALDERAEADRWERAAVARLESRLESAREDARARRTGLLAP
jgi:hypothetical protein